jgi:hypothetical protein
MTATGTGSGTLWLLKLYNQKNKHNSIIKKSDNQLPKDSRSANFWNVMYVYETYNRQQAVPNIIPV